MVRITRFMVAGTMVLLVGGLLFACAQVVPVHEPASELTPSSDLTMPDPANTQIPETGSQDVMTVPTPGDEPERGDPNAASNEMEMMYALLEDPSDDGRTDVF
jgi:hypothetical protein